MARRKRTYRRKGSNMKTNAKKVLVGIGLASLLGPGVLSAGAGYVLGGPAEAAGAFFAPQIRNLISGLGGGLSGLGGGTGSGMGESSY